MPITGPDPLRDLEETVARLNEQLDAKSSLFDVLSPPSAQEIGVYRNWGGFRIGRSALLAINGTAPFGSIVVRPDQITVGACGFHLEFPRSAIARLSISRGLISAGLRIEHTIPHYPRFIVFWSVGDRSLRKHLIDFGYEVR